MLTRVLEVNGTNGNDTIEVSSSESFATLHVSINGEFQDHDGLSAYDEIRIEGFNGNDDINVIGAGLPTSVQPGAGSNVVNVRIYEPTAQRISIGASGAADAWTMLQVDYRYFNKLEFAGGRLTWGVPGGSIAAASTPFDRFEISSKYTDVDYLGAAVGSPWTQFTLGFLGSTTALTATFGSDGLIRGQSNLLLYALSSNVRVVLDHSASPDDQTFLFNEYEAKIGTAQQRFLSYSNVKRIDVKTGSGNDAVVVKHYGPLQRAQPLPYVDYRFETGAGNDSLMLDGFGAGATFQVDAGTGNDVVATNTVVDDSGDGLYYGTLRRAILNANGLAGAQTISFDLGTPSVAATIYLDSPLPQITDADTTIDGTTQAVTGNTGQPHVVLRPSPHPAATAAAGDGLVLRGARIKLNGVEITGFGQNGIGVYGAEDVLIQGVKSIGNGWQGIEIIDAPNITVGGGVGTTPGPGNTFSNNGRAGLSLGGLNTRYAGVRGNTIIANGQEGIRITDGAHHNVVGGTEANALNRIGSNGFAGVSIYGGGAVSNQVIGNHIGIGAAGEDIGHYREGVYLNAPGNTVRSNLIRYNNLEGVRLDADADNCVVESNTIRNSDADGVHVSGASNVHVSGNTIGTSGGDGVEVTGLGATGNVVTGNAIGAVFDGRSSTALPNAGAGVSITAFAANNRIGGTAGGEGNSIYASGGAGVRVDGGPDTFRAPPSGNQILGNFIGVNSTTLKNAGEGVRIRNATATLVRGNSIGGNLLQGVHITGVGAGANTLAGNTIGVGIAGTSANPNGNVGVLIDGGATGNTIGGAAAADRNIISGNASTGVELSSGGNTVQGNHIGTDASGNAKIPNGHSGVGVTSANNVIRGNLISGNPFFGIAFSFSGTSGNVVAGNLIGTDAAGNAGTGMGNGSYGVVVQAGAAANVIGTAGLAAATGVVRTPDTNVVSGNGAAGVYLDASAGNTVAGNYVGTNAGGTVAVPNGGPAGVIVFGGFNQVVGNLISGNVGAGLLVRDSVGVVVRGNYVGASADLGGPLGNNGNGINVSGTNGGHTIGGTAAGQANRIAHNGGDGINLGASSSATPTGVTLSGNSIYSNGRLGINLVPLGEGVGFVTANDASDADAGPNNLQNRPTISTALVSGATTVISGTLSSAANASYRVEFFASDVADPSGAGEGQTYLGFVQVGTNASGLATFSGTMNLALANGQAVSATATAIGTGDTSEFSDAVVINQPAVTASAFLYETRPQRLTVTFSQNVSASMNDFQLTGPANIPPRTFAYNSATRTATLTFTGLLPDGNYTLRVVASGIRNAGNAPLPSDHTFDFFVLAGDANRDRTVGFDDLLTLAQNYGNSGRTFSQGNFDYSTDGTVGFDDLLILAQRYGSTSPALSTFALAQSPTPPAAAKRVAAAKRS